MKTKNANLIITAGLALLLAGLIAAGKSFGLFYVIIVSVEGALTCVSTFTGALVFILAPKLRIIRILSVISVLAVCAIAAVATAANLWDLSSGFSAPVWFAVAAAAVALFGGSTVGIGLVIKFKPHKLLPISDKFRIIENRPDDNAA